MEILWPEVSERTQALAADEAHVWAVPLEYGGTLDERLATLSREERERAERFRVDVPRRRFIVTRAALRVLLARYLNLAATEIVLTEGANGKPRLAQESNSTPLHFNVAHSDELALIAVAARCEVGIDVERLRTISHWEEIASRFFHDAEVRTIMATVAAERETAFLQCWTRKEAVLKASGIGLSGSLTSFHVSIGAHDGQWLKVPICEGAKSMSVWLQPLAPHRDYVGAVAVAEKRRVCCFTNAW